MYVSYHAWNDFGECPRRYFLRYRKHQRPPKPKNEYHTLYGKLVEKFFEHFCNTWRFTMPYMPPEEIRIKLERLYRVVLQTSTVDWTAPYAKDSEQTIFEAAFKDVSAIMDSHNQNYFLNTKSEISIEISTSSGAVINGRLDFVHKDATGPQVTVFDGKGSREIGKNVNPEQVLFYALLYYFHYKVFPEELGFFYYRFNTFVPVPATLATLNEFRAKLSLRTKQIMTESEFKATPSAKVCKYCEYDSICSECLEDRAKRSRKSKLDIVESDGVTEFGL